MHNHSKTHNKIVRSLLRRIASQTHQTYPQIKKLFVIHQNMNITMRFWQLFKESYPTHRFTEVSCCPDCGKFDLE